MDSQSNLFLTLLELQGLVQLHNAYYHVEEDKLINTRKLARYQEDIIKKATFLGLTEHLDKIMENKIPYIKDLGAFPLYMEFLRTNNSPIQDIYFKKWIKYGKRKIAYCTW